MPKSYDVDVLELIAAAEKHKCVETFGELLYDFYKISKSNYDVRQILIDPKFSLEFRMECVEEIFKDVKPPQFFYDFVGLILSHNMLGKLYSIYHKYLAVVAEKYNLTLLQVITAVPISKEKNSQLKSTLEKLLKKKIILKNIVDARIYGGLVLKLPPDKIIDMSIKRKLIDLNQYIRNF